METCECIACTEARAEKEEKLYQQFKKRLFAEIQGDFKCSGAIRKLIKEASSTYDHQ